MKPQTLKAKADLGRAAMNLLCTRLLCLVLLVSVMSAGARPRYGGTVRMVLQHRITSLIPTDESGYPSEQARINSLVFETLTQIDPQGHVRPCLANSWQAEAGGRVWQFQLRSAVFHSGTQLNSAAVAASLRVAGPDWKISVSGRQSLTIETPVPAPHLPEMLALPRFAIAKKMPDGTLEGTGPFKLSEWQPGERALLTANEDYWDGRAYPDAVDIRMGVSLREHLLEHRLGPDHAAELSVDQVRALEQSNQNLLTSRPADLMALVFLQRSPQAAAAGRKTVDPRIREAISMAMSRAAISNVLLQRRSAPARGLLPQWLTGYEFLLPAENSIENARKLRAEVNSTAPLTLAYDFSDPVAKLVAERIAVDAREAGIFIQTLPDLHTNTALERKTVNADAVLLRLPLQSLDPAAALAGLESGLELSGDIHAAILSASRPEDLLEAERKALEDHRIVPVVHVSQALWLNNNVHNWQLLPNGMWKLDQLWVEGTK
ncbi:MAG TPA: ABC transporter substrate-binding protein [Candidatus Angelobacter sp.]|jgi:ABC-type transport system substrate-binding protein|nr:ABC transporter substrate-binding protein [Candidatus Angelobacter sp.]